MLNRPFFRQFLTHALLGAIATVLPVDIRAASFAGNARIEVADPTAGLTWNPSTNKISVSCWLKFSIPSGVSLSENLTILANQQAYDQDKPFAYLIQLNLENGNLEFRAQGNAADRLFVGTLVERPYLERWYYIAVVREADTFSGYVDGRRVFSVSKSIGNSASESNGLSIGGWGGGRWLYGEVQELTVYQNALQAETIRQRMFTETPTNNNPALRAYLKLADSTNTADRLRNFATNAPPSSETGVVSGVGTILFEDTNQAGEQSLFDSRKNHGADGTVPLSGSFAWEQVLLSRPTPGITFDLRFGYFSGNAFSSSKLGEEFNPFESPVLSPGWRHSFETRVLPGQSFDPAGSGLAVVGIMDWQGSIETWDLDYSDWKYKTRHKQYRGELIIESAGFKCEWITPDRLVYRFHHPFHGTNEALFGRLKEIADFNNNRVLIDWNDDGTVKQVTDAADAVCRFSYNGTKLVQLDYLSWSVLFQYDPSGRLVSKSLSNSLALYTNVNTTWGFAYYTNGPSSNLLHYIRDPRDFTNVIVGYDKYGRRDQLIDGLGRANRTQYGVPGKRQITHTDPDQRQWTETYDRKGRVVAQQDPLTNVTRYAYDPANGNRVSITEPLGWTTFFGYDDRANVIARTNDLGEVTRWVFHTNSLTNRPHFNKPIMQITPQPTNVNGSATWTNFYVLDDNTGNLLVHYDYLHGSSNALVRYTYETNGLVLMSVDANAHTNRFAYDTNGFLTTSIDAAGFTNSFSCNDVGWKLSQTNALGEVTTFAYDINGNVVQTVDPLQRVFRKVYDPNGNLTSASDGKGQWTSFGYDAANQRTNMLDRTGTNTWTYTYSRRGKLETTQSPIASIVSTNFYDAANRLERVSDAMGNSITNIYDANGNLTVLVDQLTNRWSKIYDRLNRVIYETDPQGNTKETRYDQAGRIEEILTPMGYPSRHEYDGRGRLKKWTDAERFEWLYTYDGVGNILDIEDALHGHYGMSYGPRNERLTERNQDQKEWVYTYDELLHLKTQRDPNGTVRTLSYDAGGRIEAVTFSTGRINSFQYDENNNPIVLSRSGSGPPTISSLDYDVMDRVTEYRDTFSKRVGYGRDALGRTTNLAYPGGKVLTQEYDRLSRLTNQVFVFSATRNFTNTYAYDRANRLVRRTFPNGVVQANAFDSAGRITNLVHQASGILTPGSIQVALTYAYDRNGNKVGSTERGTLVWSDRLPAPRDERTSFTAAGRLIEKTDVLSPTNHFTYHYDASGNMTNAVGWQSCALTYDEDNRTTSICWQVGALCDKTITNRYDAFGRRVAKTADGTETRYVLDLAGSMERILCDVATNGVVLAYYIHGPDLAFKVDASGGLTCYHADAQANIIALTGDTGTNVAQYAYTPYGRSLGASDPCSPTSDLNPYRFVGSQGVMEELPNLYFMRARYYSAEAGVFLSTDPVKHIGPGWQPAAYSYAGGNPLHNADPNGEVVSHTIAFLGGLALGVVSEYALDFISEDSQRMLIAMGIPETMVRFGFDTVELARTVLGGAAALASFDPTFHGSAFSAGYAVGHWGYKAAKVGGQILSDYIGSESLEQLPPAQQAARTQQQAESGHYGTRADIRSLPPDAMKPSPGTEPGGNTQRQGQSLSERGSGAGSYAINLNIIQSPPPTPPAVHEGTVSGLGTPGTGAGNNNNAFAATVRTIQAQAASAANGITQFVQQAANNTGQAITNMVRAAGNWWNSLWGGGGAGR